MKEIGNKMNNITMVARLTKDPELRKTPSNKSVVNFTLADDNPTTRGGEKTTSFIPCVSWNLTAENIAKYCHKGSLVAVSGKLTQRSYKKSDGTINSIIEILVDSIQFLESKSKEEELDNEEEKIDLPF